MKRSKKTLVGHVKHYCVPHKENAFKPKVFALKSIIVIAAILVGLQGVFILQNLLLKNDAFLASVLPGALTALTNEDRSAQGASKLVFDKVLAQAAQLKAEDMAERGYFSHIDPDGRSPWFWFDSVNYEYKRAGENLAINFSESIDVEEAWMNSPAHRENILKSEFTNVGIGVANGTYEGKSTTFVVQFFATPARSAAAVASVPANKENETQVPKEVTSDTVIANSESDTRVLGIVTDTANTKDEAVTAKTNDTVAATGALSPLENTWKAAKECAAICVTSPSTIFIPIFGAIFGILLILFCVAIFVHARVQYIEILAGGMLLLVIAGALYWFANTQVDHSVTLPENGQSASIILSL